MEKNESSEILTLNIRRQLNASVDAVFQAWTDADTLSQWFAPSDDFTVKVPVMDVQVGGQYRIEMTNPDGETFSAIGEYLEMSRPGKLVFTWSWDGGDSGMLVTIALADLDGKTELLLTHEKFPDIGSRDHHDEGWTGCLNRLTELVNQGE